MLPGHLVYLDPSHGHPPPTQGASSGSRRAWHLGFEEGDGARVRCRLITPRRLLQRSGWLPEKGKHRTPELERPPVRSDAKEPHGDVLGPLSEKPGNRSMLEGCEASHVLGKELPPFPGTAGEPPMVGSGANVTASAVDQTEK